MEQMVSDPLWNAFEPLIPKHPRSPKGGRHRADDRKCLEGLVYVLRTGTPWHLFPKKEFGVAKSTVYDRFTEWTKAGVFSAGHHALLNELGLEGKIDMSAAVVDSSSVRAVFGGFIPDRAPWTGVKAGPNATSSATPPALRC